MMRRSLLPLLVLMCLPHPYPPPHVIESLTDIPLDDFHPRTDHQTNTESLSFPVTSPDPVTADMFVTPGGIISRSTSATSTYTPPLPLPPHPLLLPFSTTRPHGTFRSTKRPFFSFSSNSRQYTSYS
ncbi:hypothetical protein H4582DRAFT_1100214 [Lactarius indigo]|nr:hypothetical protein H4582DRAFT_1100214 [Lactarius indigo]